MSKKYKHLWKTDQNTLQTNYRKVLISSKRSLTEYLMRFSGHAGTKLTEKGILHQRHSKVNPFWLIPVLESNWDCSIKSAIREVINLKPDPQWKKQTPTTEATRSINTAKVKWKPQRSLYLCLNSISASGQEHVCISKTSIYFWSGGPETKFGHKQVHRKVPLLGFKTQLLR